MAKVFRSWEVDQGWLLPPSLHEFVPPGHMAHCVRDTVREALDLSAILDTYSEERGYPPYNPGLMVALLLYGGDDRAEGEPTQGDLVGPDKAYDAEDFVNELRSMNVRAHVAQNTSGPRSSIDRRTTHHAGYGMSQKIRKRIEEGFGWIKAVGGQRKTRFKGRDRVGWAFAFTAAAYNLVRLPKPLGALA